MIPKVYTHRVNEGRNICKADSYIRVKDIKRIKEIRNKFVKYGIVFEEENPKELETTLHLIVRIPYRLELIENDK